LAHHRFYEKHGHYRFENSLSWLQDPENVPRWEPQIPTALGLDEPGDDARCKEFDKYIHEPWGCVLTHMFFWTAYGYKLRDDVDRIGQDKVTGRVNASGNDIFDNDDIRQLVKDRKQENKPLLETENGVMLARLFNYWECHKKGINPHLFKLRPRSAQYADCPVCAARFGSGGFIIIEPSLNVDCGTWEYEDAVPGGFRRGETKI
jgi:hypothetical protein